MVWAACAQCARSAAREGQLARRELLLRWAGVPATAGGTTGWLTSRARGRLRSASPPAAPRPRSTPLTARPCGDTARWDATLVQALGEGRLLVASGAVERRRRRLLLLRGDLGVVVAAAAAAAVARAAAAVVRPASGISGPQVTPLRSVVEHSQGRLRDEGAAAAPQAATEEAAGCRRVAAARTPAGTVVRRGETPLST
eukprot:COSAG01_NODE_12278_length_1767_cov_6.212830_2_plen_199_part_00